MLGSLRLAHYSAYSFPVGGTVLRVRVRVRARACACVRVCG